MQSALVNILVPFQAPQDAESSVAELAHERPFLGLGLAHGQQGSTWGHGHVDNLQV